MPLPPILKKWIRQWLEDEGSENVKYDTNLDGVIDLNAVETKLIDILSTYSGPDFTTTSTTFVDVTHATITFDLPADSEVLVLYITRAGNNTAGENVYVCVNIDGTDVVDSPDGDFAVHTSSTANAVSTIVAFAHKTLTAGTHTVKGRAKVSAGTGNLWDYGGRLIVFIFKV